MFSMGHTSTNPSMNGIGKCQKPLQNLIKHWRNTKDRRSKTNNDKKKKTQIWNVLQVMFCLCWTAGQQKLCFGIFLFFFAKLSQVWQFFCFGWLVYNFNVVNLKFFVVEKKWCAWLQLWNFVRPYLLQRRFSTCCRN